MRTPQNNTNLVTRESCRNWSGAKYNRSNVLVRSQTRKDMLEAVPDVANDAVHKEHVGKYVAINKHTAFMKKNRKNNCSVMLGKTCNVHNEYCPLCRQDGKLLQRASCLRQAE